MLYNTHVYFAKRVDNELNPLKIAGSMFPDFAKTGLITWDDLHKKEPVLNFSNFINKNYPDSKSFVDGIICHIGLDYTSHLEYKNANPGYAYKNVTPELYGFVEKALGLNEPMTKSLSHNFIEAAVDYHLSHETLEPVSLIKKTALEIDMAKLAKVLSEYFGKSVDEMFEGVKEFFSFVTRFDLTDIDGHVKLFVDLGTSFLKVNADKAYTRKALELAFELTKETWKEYLETSISNFDGEIKDST